LEIYRRKSQTVGQNFQIKALETANRDVPNFRNISSDRESQSQRYLLFSFWEEVGPNPWAQSVGSVQVTRLAKTVAMEVNNSNRYVELDLPHPTFVANAKIQISASGGTLPGFRLAWLSELTSVWHLE